MRPAIAGKLLTEASYALFTGTRTRPQPRWAA